MKRFCVFCGNRPQDKNREHVIPQWLIGKTGNPNRKARFGLDLRRDPPQVREFAFDSFTFPACSQCNNNFSELEGKAEKVITSLLSCGALSELDLIILLDWLDKVRVGLWLGYLYLNQNPRDVRPSFHIKSRMGKTDRSVGILRMPGDHSGINFIGVDSPCFQFSPTCFALLIEDFCFVNVVGVSICSQRLGFPFARPEHLREDGRLEASIHAGTAKVMRPVLKDMALANAVLLHQPVCQIGVDTSEPPTACDSEWLRSRTLNWKEGLGGVFLEKDRLVARYPSEKTLDWLPESRWKLNHVYRCIVPFVYGRLMKDLDLAALISAGEQRKTLLQDIAHCERIHSLILARLRREVPWK